MPFSSNKKKVHIIKSNKSVPSLNLDNINRDDTNQDEEESPNYYLKVRDMIRKDSNRNTNRATEDGGETERPIV